MESRRELATALGIGASTVLLGTAVVRWIGRPTLKGPTAVMSPLDIGEDHSVLLADGSRASLFAKDGKIVDNFDGVRTLYEGFQRGLRESAGGPCLGTRLGDGPFAWTSYQEVYDQAHAIGSALKAKMQLSKGDIVAVFAQNRHEWVVTEQGCNHFSLVLVPLYDTLGTDACMYILKQTAASVAVVDSEEKARTLLKSDEMPSSFRHIVLTGTAPSDEIREAAAGANVELHAWSDMMQFGLDNQLPAELPEPNDLATICYTSGTTGDPKGVQLTHQNIVSNMAGVYDTLFAKEMADLMMAEALNPSDSYLSYLPLAHMFERAVMAMVLMSGMRAGFSRGDVRLLLEDLQELKPTLFATVPRLLNRIYDRVSAGVAGSRVKQWLLDKAVRQKTQMLRRGEIRRDTIWDRLVFSRVHQLTGGRIRFLVTGSAPIGTKVMEFVRAAFGCPVFEGYGQTEATAAVTVTLLGDCEMGHVGPPATCNVVKLADVPDMGYLSANGQGEVCVKGSNVFSGYYKLPEKTAEAFDDEGWLRTGDIGEWTPNGCLRIIDRRKHLFKLAQGEYVAPEKIEQLLNRSQFVAQIFVDGNSLEFCVLGVVVPDPEIVLPWAKSRGLSQEMSQLCRRDGPLRTAILQDLARIGREVGLKGFEMVKDVHLYPELFSVENGLLTPTFKSKRPELRSRFRQEFADMYTALHEAAAPAAT